MSKNTIGGVGSARWGFSVIVVVVIFVFVFVVVIVSMLDVFPKSIVSNMENLPEHDSYTDYLKDRSLGEKPPRYPCLETWGCHGHRIMAGRRGMEVGRTTPLVEIL